MIVSGARLKTTKRDVQLTAAMSSWSGFVEQKVPKELSYENMTILVREDFLKLISELKQFEPKEVGHLAKFSYK